jgi:hypothetical protein
LCRPQNFDRSKRAGSFVTEHVLAANIANALRPTPSFSSRCEPPPALLQDEQRADAAEVIGMLTSNLEKITETQQHGGTITLDSEVNAFTEFAGRTPARTGALPRRGAAVREALALHSAAGRA